MKDEKLSVFLKNSIASIFAKANIIRSKADVVALAITMQYI